MWLYERLGVNKRNLQDPHGGKGKTILVVRLTLFWKVLGLKAEQRKKERRAVNDPCEKCGYGGVLARFDNNTTTITAFEYKRTTTYVLEIPIMTEMTVGRGCN